MIEISSSTQGSASPTLHTAVSFCLRAKPASILLPPFESADALIASHSLVPSPPVIHGLLHRGDKGALGSGSKMGKTWLLLDLAVSVANGSDFLHWPTTQGQVLYVNFELKKEDVTKRPLKTLPNHHRSDLQGDGGSI